MDRVENNVEDGMGNKKMRILVFQVCDLLSIDVCEMIGNGMVVAGWYRSSFSICMVYGVW